MGARLNRVPRPFSSIIALQIPGVGSKLVRNLNQAYLNQLLLLFNGAVNFQGDDQW